LTMMLDPQRGADESPADYEARVHALSTLYRTPMTEGTLAWHQWGSTDKPPLLLLHGGFGSWRHWILNVVPLSQHFQVFCADLPGLGESDRIPGEYTADNIAAQVLHSIDHLLGTANAFRLVGFSFGGIIASHVAALAGDRVHQLVEIAPGALGLPGDFPELASLGGQRGAENVARIHRTNLGRLMIHDEARVDDLALHLQIETVSRARARSGPIPHTDVAAKALARCVCPIAGVWGELDVIAKNYMSTRVKLFRDIQPDCPFEIIEGAGHWVMYERPDACNQVLLKLLR
jgi:pimeloyl-ACP methyl ester carboxylesterase